MDDLSSQRLGPWQMVFSGRQVFVFDDRHPEDFVLEDVVHHLANTCRYSGGSKLFYSVAQHSVEGCRLLAEHGAAPILQLAFLFHDAGEAFLPDLAAPVKSCFFCSDFMDEPDADGHYPLIPFEVVERRLRAAIALNATGRSLPFDDPLVKHVDDVMLFWEKRDILNSTRVPWSQTFPPGDISMPGLLLKPHPAPYAKMEFTDMLKGVMDQL